MEPENTYIRSSDMDEQASETTNENGAPWGGWEWFKTILFLSILFIAGFVTINVAGPMLFTDYVPGIIGLDSQESDDAGEMAEPAEPDATTGDSDDTAETPREEDSDQPAESSEDGEMAEGEASGEAEPATESVEEAGTTGKIEDESSDTSDDGEVEQAPAEPEVEVYIVQIGDTLTSIAAVYGTTVDEIIAVNQFLNPNYVQLGQEINIPK